MQLDFFCERKIYEAYMQGINFLGFFLSYVTLILFPLPVKFINQFLPIVVLCTGILLMSVYFFNNFFLISLVLFGWAYGRGLFYSLIFIYLKSNMKGELPNVGS